MDFGTYLQTEIYFPRKTYTDKWQVEQDLDETRALMHSARCRLRQLAFITEPNKFCGDNEGGDPMDWVELRFNEAIDSFKEAYSEALILRLLLDQWNNIKRDKDGRFILPPTTDTSYLYGDFIPSDETKE